MKDFEVPNAAHAARIANPANPANPASQLAPLAGLASPKDEAARSPVGRFLTGNNGGGRPKGSRNKLTDVYLAAVNEDFALHGRSVLARIRESDPVTYLRFVSSLVPRELVLQREKDPDFAHMTPDEVHEQFEIAFLRRSYRKHSSGA